jgi:CheY-like chemotaxis protein
VDDEEAIVDVVKEMLEMLGYQVLVADNGGEGSGSLRQTVTASTW